MDRVSGQGRSESRFGRGPEDAAKLLLSRDVLDEMVVHLAGSLPAEGCGLLAVEPAGSSLSAVQYFPGTNVDRSPTRYTMDPAEVLAALMEIDQRGWRLGAIVHSHPAGPATPSRIDLAEARYPEAMLAILGFATRPPELRFWCLHDGGGNRWVEVDWRVVGASRNGSSTSVGRGPGGRSSGSAVGLSEDEG